MKKNLFEMGAKFEDGWSSDNKEKKKNEKIVIKKPNEHRLVFAKERRRGKIVTIIKPFFLDKKDFKELLAKIKKALNSGGTIKQNTIELQGEVKEKAKGIKSSRPGVDEKSETLEKNPKDILAEIIDQNPEEIAKFVKLWLRSKD